MEQLMQEQKDNENKLHKFDIIEKFQEVEIEKKQRKDNQRRISIRYRIPEVHNDLFLNEGETDDDKPELSQS